MKTPRTSYLIIGLESSCTKLIARLIAANLIPGASWDGNHFLMNDDYVIVHRSLPNGYRYNYPTVEDTLGYNYVIICTRDYNISLRSKSSTHQPDYSEAVKEHLRGIKLIRQIMKVRQTTIINYEAAHLLKYAYLNPILDSIGVPCHARLRIYNANKKHIV